MTSRKFRASNSWNDLPPTPITAARLGSTAPTLATLKTDVESYTFDASNDYVLGAAELEHTYQTGTDVEIHVHWVTNGSDADARYVKYQMKYVTMNVGGVVSAQSTASTELTIPAGTTDRTYYVSTIGTITGTNIALGSYICYRFERITAAGTAPSNDPFVIAVGFHVRQDSTGSLTEYTK